MTGLRPCIGPTQPLGDAHVQLAGRDAGAPRFMESPLGLVPCIGTLNPAVRIYVTIATIFCSNQPRFMESHDFVLLSALRLRVGNLRPRLFGVPASAGMSHARPPKGGTPNQARFMQSLLSFFGSFGIKNRLGRQGAADVSSAELLAISSAGMMQAAPSTAFGAVRLRRQIFNCFWFAMGPIGLN